MSVDIAHAGQTPKQNSQRLLNRLGSLATHSNAQVDEKIEAMNGRNKKIKNKGN